MQDMSGDAAQTLERLVREHQRPLLRVCYLYLHDESMAEDAVQDTFLKALRSLSGYRQEASEKTWLTRIAINTCKDMLRSAWLRHVDRRVTPDMLPHQSAADPYNSEVTAAVMNLPRKERETIILYYYQDISTVDIARMMGISQPAVSGRLDRARKKLRKALEGGVLNG